MSIVSDVMKHLCPKTLLLCRIASWFEEIDHSNYSTLGEAIGDIYPDNGKTLQLYLDIKEQLKASS